MFKQKSKQTVDIARSSIYLSFLERHPVLLALLWAEAGAAAGTLCEEKAISESDVKTLQTREAVLFGQRCKKSAKIGRKTLVIGRET